MSERVSLARACVTIGLVMLACERTTEFAGIYVARPDVDTTLTYAPGGASVFFPCDAAERAWTVDDSIVRSRAAAAAGGSVPMFMRVRGARIESRGYGSPGGGAVALRVEEIVELRPRRPGDCPIHPDTVLRALTADTT